MRNEVTIETRRRDMIFFIAMWIRRCVWWFEIWIFQQPDFRRSDLMVDASASNIDKWFLIKLCDDIYKWTHTIYRSIVATKLKSINFAVHKKSMCVLWPCQNWIDGSNRLCCNFSATFSSLLIWTILTHKQITNESCRYTKYYDKNVCRRGRENGNSKISMLINSPTESNKVWTCLQVPGSLYDGIVGKVAERMIMKMQNK